MGEASQDMSEECDAVKSLIQVRDLSKVSKVPLSWDADGSGLRLGFDLVTLQQGFAPSRQYVVRTDPGIVGGFLFRCLSANRVWALLCCKRLRRADAFGLAKIRKPDVNPNPLAFSHQMRRRRSMAQAPM